MLSPRILVNMTVDCESCYTPEEQATYPTIKDYVKEKYGLNVSSCISLKSRANTDWISAES